MVNKIKVVCLGCYEMFYTSQSNPKSTHDRICYLMSGRPDKKTKEIFDIKCRVCGNNFKSTRENEEFCSSNCGTIQFRNGTRENSLPVEYKRGDINNHLLKQKAQKKLKKKLDLEKKIIAKEKLKDKIASDKKCKSVEELSKKYKVSQSRVRAILFERGIDKFKKKTTRQKFNKTCETCKTEFYTFVDSQKFCKKTCIRWKKSKRPDKNALQTLLKEHTLDFIGKNFSVTRERVRQWAMSILEKTGKLG